MDVAIEYSPLKPKGYLPRIVDAEVKELLSEFGAVEICGTRFCGKSWTSQAFGQSLTRIDNNPSLYRDDPHLALAGAQPHIVDEWQYAPNVWNAARHSIDDSANKPGQFILTGSSAPLEDKKASARHSGAGRIAHLTMRTMSLFEQGVSDGSVSLKRLFQGEFSSSPSDLSLSGIAAACCHGGWPSVIARKQKSSARVVEEYLNALFEESIVKVGKNSDLARRIARSLARNVATSAKLSTVAEDSSVETGTAPATETVASYIQEFKRNYFVEELPGWDAPVRAKSRLRTKPKRYFADASLATGLLGLDEDRLVADNQLFGLVFESLAIHDIAVYAQGLRGYTRGSLRYYSDADGLEVDVIIELSDGRWAGIEIKLGESKVAEGIANLDRLRRKVALNPAARNPEPVFMAVLLGRGDIARYIKDKNVYVIPIGTLGP